MSGGSWTRGAAVAMVAVLASSGQPFSFPAVRAQEYEAEGGVPGLIRQLSAESYEERERATSALIDLADYAREELLDAAESEDAETRLRAERVLEAVRENDLWEPSRVTFIAEEAPVERVLDEIARQTGNRILTGPRYGNLNGVPVSGYFQGTSFWEAIEDVCRQTGNTVRPSYSPAQPGHVVVSGRLGLNPTAYAGPLRAVITSGRRSFREDIDFTSTQARVTHTFELELDVMWEDRFRPIAVQSSCSDRFYWPRLVEARTDTGQQLGSTQFPSRAWTALDDETRRLPFKLQLDPPDSSATGLELLRLEVGLLAVGDPATLRVTGLDCGLPHQRDDFVVIVENVQPTRTRWEVTLLVTRASGVPEPREVLFYENAFAAYDAEGARLRLAGQTNVFVDATPAGQTSAGREPRPFSGVRTVLAFSPFDGPSDELIQRSAYVIGMGGPSACGWELPRRPAVLECTYPRIRSRRFVELEFRDVPLPAARPE